MSLVDLFCLSLLTLAAFCFFIAYMHIIGVRVVYLNHVLPHGQRILLEMNVGRLSFQISVLRTALRWFDYGQHEFFGYRWVNLFNLAIKWKVKV